MSEFICPDKLRMRQPSTASLFSELIPGESAADALLIDPASAVCDSVCPGPREVALFRIFGRDFFQQEICPMLASHEEQQNLG